MNNYTFENGATFQKTKGEAEILKRTLAALTADYARLCNQFCKKPELSESYRAAKLEVEK